MGNKKHRQSKAKTTKFELEPEGQVEIPAVDFTTYDFKNVDPDTLPQKPEGTLPYVCDPDGEAFITLAKKGVASLPPTTVMARFKKCRNLQGDNVALRVERDGKWVEWTWKKYYDDVCLAARSMIHLGLEPHQSVNIIGFNAPEWFIGDLAAIAAGGKAAGIYPTNGPEACKYIAQHSDARVIICEDDKQLSKFLKIRDELPLLVALVVYTGDVPEGANVKGKCKVYNWADFLALSSQVSEQTLEERMVDQKPGHACTLIYTSGTTGNPKAVMISNDNITWTPDIVFGMVDSEFGKVEEHVVSYLPLSHVAAQMLDIHVPMAIVSNRGGNCTVHFAKPDALKGSLGQTLKDVRPTYFFGVPRVWEKFAEKIQQVGASLGFVTRQVSAFLKGKMSVVYETNQFGKKPERPMFTDLAEKKLSAVKVALGLDRCKLHVSAAAPIALATLRYFGSLGIIIYELYGMSESTGPETSCFPGHYKIGSVGPALFGCELKVDHDAARGDREGEGELLFRGRHIMMGYMKDEEKTKETIDKEGWLHSGDIGQVDEHGFLRITGRIKELIVTAGGENVAPIPVEDAIKEACPGIKNVVMIGDKRKFNIALITLHLKENEDGSHSSELLEPSAKIAGVKTISEAKDHPDVKAAIQAAVDAANKKAVSNAAVVQKWALLETDFSIASGELTPTLKLKRTVVQTNYAEIINELYGEAHPDEVAEKPSKSAKKSAASPSKNSKQSASGKISASEAQSSSAPSTPATTKKVKEEKPVDAAEEGVSTPLSTSKKASSDLEGSKKLSKRKSKKSVADGAADE